jgi:hypothetical protein
MIKRWPRHVMATRRHQATNPTSEVKQQAKGLRNDMIHAFTENDLPIRYPRWD